MLSTGSEVVKDLEGSLWEERERRMNVSVVVAMR